MGLFKKKKVKKEIEKAVSNTGYKLGGLYMETDIDLEPINNKIKDNANKINATDTKLNENVAKINANTQKLNDQQQLINDNTNKINTNTNNINNNVNGITNINQRLNRITNDLANSNIANYKGTFVNNKSYNLGDLVSDPNNTNVYLSIKNNNTSPLTDNAAWKVQITSISYPFKIELLQPITLGTTEIVPIRYCFLSKVNTTTGITGYTIPLSIGFMEGFKAFLKSVIYNNPSYNINLGSTLPTNNGKYNRMIEQIEIQKNNGISSSIGNLISRPLNWIGGGFGKIARTGNISGIDDDGELMRYADDSIDVSWNNKYGTWEYEPDRRYNNIYNRLSGGLTIGGIGGFIGDFISIGNTLKQTDFLKKNVGVGYITTTEEDLFNSIIHNDFMTGGYQTPLQLQSQTLLTAAGIKLFTDNTKYKYRNYFENFGFAINDFIKSSFINEIIAHSKKWNENVFFSIDKDWCLMYLTDLANFTDNVVKNSIIDQLSAGIRMKNIV